MQEIQSSLAFVKTRWVKQKENTQEVGEEASKEELGKKFEGEGGEEPLNEMQYVYNR